MNRITGLALIALTLVTVPMSDAFARGFGGFHGANLGGFRGENFGGFRSENFRRFDAPGIERFPAERVEQYRPEAAPRSYDYGSRSRDAYDRDRIPDRDVESRTDLDRFLGLPTDAGLGHIAGEDAPTRVDPLRAGVGARTPFGTPGAVTRERVDYIPAERRADQAWTVRNSFRRYNLFTPEWYKTHRNAWIAAGIVASAWAAPAWFDASDWIGCDPGPTSYDYGSTVIYEGGNVISNGQNMGSAEQYYDQAGSLAATGASDLGDKSQWMSLGVFGIVQGNQTDPTIILQLSVNHEGVIRGNYFDTVTETSSPISGAVDKKTQRAAWTIGDNKNTVFDTGLYNLTQDQAPALVHLGKDRTQEWLMVRLKNKDDAGNNS
jgi:hypothetical protein